MSYLKPVVFCIILTLSASHAFAWGATGHKITATVAYSQLDQSVKDSLKYYLGGMSLEDASTWMDEIRSETKYDYLKPYHYINIDKGAKYDPTDSVNIVGELKKVIAELRNRKNLSKEQIFLDLKILTHLMGDLHQPLHVGYASDIGGNSVLLTFMSWNSNLHRVWDSDIIEQDNVKAKECIKLLAKIPTDSLAKLQKVNLVSWMIDSRRQLPQAYNFKGNKIDYDYALKNTDVIERQLAVGGLRLATLLKEFFGSK